MKGANADPSAKTISMPKAISTKKIGASQNFLRTRMKRQISEKRENFDSCMMVGLSHTLPKIRSTKSEMRNKYEIANPKFQTNIKMQIQNISFFGFRYSNYGFLFADIFHQKFCYSPVSFLIKMHTVIIEALCIFSFAKVRKEIMKLINVFCQSISNPIIAFRIFLK